MTGRHRLRRIFWDPIEALFAILAYYAIRLLGLDSASALGGWLGPRLGPLLPVHRIAARNLELALPELSAAERHAILRRMWVNLGRTFFEFPHLDRIADPKNGRIELVGRDVVEAMRDERRGGLFFSAHLANWEVGAMAPAQFGLRAHAIYRRPNNLLIDFLFRRRGNAYASLLPKGREGARGAIALLNKGERLALLVDQKMNDGIAVPFFGRPAMTAPALAQFALRYRIPAIPARVVRVKGARFRVEFLPPLDLPPGNGAAEILALMTHVNGLIEGWIREHPDQWLWVHRRWPK